MYHSLFSDMGPSNQPPIMDVALRHINLETHVPQAQRPTADTGIAIGDPVGLDSVLRNVRTCPGPSEQRAPEPSGREAHVAAPSSTDFKNEWSFTSTPACLPIVTLNEAHILWCERVLKLGLSPHNE